MIQIHGLTAKQMKLCDKIWSMDTTQEMLEWFDTLPTSEKYQAYCMLQMITAEVLDQEEFGDMAEAREVIDRVRAM